MNRTILAELIGVLALGAGLSVSAAVEVSPDGPIRSLQAAFAELRKQDAGSEKRIVVADGRYVLSEPLVLTAADSGTAEHPVVVEAAAGANPVFSGGTRLPPMQPMTNGKWRLKVPGSLRCEQLYVDGKAATLARSPNAGSYYAMTSAEEQVIEEDAEEFKAGAYQFIGIGDAPLPVESAGIWLTAFHKWDMTRRPVLGSEDGSVLIGRGKMKSWNPLRAGTRFFLENHLSYLDAPGEWYLGDDAQLHYVPSADQRAPEVEVVAPRLPVLIQIAGIPAARVEHVVFRGLTFAHSAYASPADGFSPAQAANSVGAAIEIDYARHVVFDACTIRETATYGLWLRDGCQRCEVRNCTFEELGAGGVRIGQTAVRPNEVSLSRANRVTDSRIRNGGILFPPAVGILLAHAADNEILHNEIAHLRYTGISVGWTWGYDDSVAKGNKIAWNHLHHLGGPLSDLGGVYTLGPSPGTVISHNFIHDVDAHSYGGWGLYCDEGSSDVLLENNVVVNTKTGGFHQHYGRNNLVRNNVFVDAAEYQLQFTRAEDHRSFSFERNVVVYDRGTLMQGRWQQGRIDQHHNCYWNRAGEVVFPTGDLASWQAVGREQSSYVADPLLQKASNGSYSIPNNSPARKTGFTPFSLNTVGPRR